MAAALTIVPIIILALVVHEGGHYLMARLLGIKTAAFQIGVGPRIFTWWRGGTQLTTRADQETPRPGQIIHAWYEPTADGNRLVKWIPDVRRPRRLGGPYIWELAKDAEAEHPRLTGKVAIAEQGRLVIKDQAFALAAIPVAALVQLVDDPKRENRRYHNAAPWLQQIAIIGAGVGANVMLMLTAIAILALAPPPAPSEILEITRVQTASPASAAGLQPGDQIVQAGNATLWPTGNELREEIQKSAAANREMTLMVNRGQDTLLARLTAEPESGTIGITIQRRIPQASPGQGSPSALTRFLRITTVYVNAVAQTVNPPTANQEAEGTPHLSGMIAAAQMTSQAVKTAKWHGWLTMLAVMSMSMAIMNMLPIPPLDGYQVVLATIRTLRKGKPISQKAEVLLTMSGLWIIVTVTIYVNLKDIQAILW